MKRERQNKNINVRLTLREHQLIEKMSRQAKTTKSNYLRKFMIDKISDDEPDYTPDEQEDDKVKITEMLNYINANILSHVKNLSLRQRESVLSKLAELNSILRP